MIRPRTLRLAALSLFLILYISGCIMVPGSKIGDPQIGHPQFGTVQGQVISDAHPAGVRGVLVYIEGTSLSTVTDENGLYSFERVPAGTHTVVVEFPTHSAQPSMLLAGLSTQGTQPTSHAGVLTLAVSEGAKPQLLLDGETISIGEALQHPASIGSTDQVMVNIEVRPNQANVVATISVPVFGSIDALFLYHATPSLATRLQAGQTTDFYFDIHYSLSSANSGTVFVLLRVKNEQGGADMVVEKGLPATKGAWNALIEASLTVPSQPHVDLYVALTDATGKVLVLKSAGTYPVDGGGHPIVPALQVTGYAGRQLHFGLQSGDPKGFVRYDLFASHEANSGCSGMLLFSSDDPQLKQFAIVNPPERVTTFYQLCMVTEDGVIRGGSVPYTLPWYGISTFAIPGTATGLVADPVRDVIYVAMDDRNHVAVLSTVTDRIESVIPVGVSPRNLAIEDDGSYLYVSHRAGTSVAVIDLYHREVERWIPVGRGMSGMAFDALTRRLYVRTVADGESMIRAMDVDTGEVQIQGPVFSDADRLFLRPDGSELFYSASITDYRVLSTADLTELGQIHNRQMQFNHPVFVGDRVYLTDRIFDAGTYAYVEEQVLHPVLHDTHSGHLYAFGGLLPDQATGYRYNYLYELVLDSSTDEWKPIARADVHLNRNALPVLSGDGRYMYFINDVDYSRSEMIKIDFALRRSIADY